MNIRLNEDKEHIKLIRENLKKNNGYCPCSLVKSEDTKCMCKEFRDMEHGWCHCHLYYKD